MVKIKINKPSKEDIRTFYRLMDEHHITVKKLKGHKYLLTANDELIEGVLMYSHLPWEER
jgi:hypothetical protein